MPRVKLGDVAREYKATVKDNAGFPIVGLEHLSPGEITLDCWDTDVETTFTKSFKKGHMLFGRRRAYLKKAALAPFDGVCSGDIIVIEAIPGKINPELLPFIIQNDLLFDYAVGNSSGSLSPRVKWESLKEYEFELPEISKQAELVDLLEAAYNTRKAYQQLIIACDELVKSQFIELFGDPITNSKSLPMKALSEVASSRLGKMLDAKKQTGKYRYPYLANFNVQWFHFDFSTLNQMDFNEDDQVEFSLENGDLMVCEGGEVGRCAIWREEIEHCFFQKAVHRVRCDTTQILPEYLAWWFKFHSSYNGFEDIIGSKSTIAHLPGVKLKALQIPVPNIDTQQVFVSFFEQLDKSKFELKQAIANVSELMKSLIQQDFTN